MQRLTFGQRKLNSILTATMAEMLVGTALSMTDSAIVGHLIGLDALAAINTVMPLTTLSLFLGTVVSSGATLAYSNAIGAFQKEKADGVFGLALLAESVFGIALFLLSLFAPPVYIRHIGLSAPVAALLRDYMRFYAFFLLLRPLNTLLTAMVFCDGGERVGAASSIASSAGNAVFSLLLGWRLGIRGIALGTLLSTLLSFGILSAHLFSRRSTLRPSLRFSPSDLVFILRTGINSDIMFLYLTLLAALCSRIVTKRFGEEYLPMLTVLYAVIELNVALESAGEAIKPLTGAYLGEKNYPALRALLDYTRRVNLLLGACMSLLLLAAAPLIPYVFDLGKNAALYAVCVKGLRVYAVSFVPMAWLALYDSYWLYIGRQGLSLFSNTLKYFACAAVFTPPLSYLLGPVGLWTGFALAPVLSLLIVWTVGLWRYGPRRFPALMEEDGVPAADYSLRLTPEEIADLQQRAEAFLRAEGTDRRTVYRVSLMLEELLNLIADKNPGKSVYAECCLRVEDGDVTMTLWDSGSSFDITQEGAAPAGLSGDTLSTALEGLRRQVAASIVGRREKRYQLSLGLNRYFIRFEKEESKRT